VQDAAADKSGEKLYFLFFLNMNLGNIQWAEGFKKRFPDLGPGTGI
jgi:hypothetical protein